MALDFKLKGNSKFQDLGSLDEYFDKYGETDCYIEDLKSSNIKLLFKTKDEIEIILTCSQQLSDIIKKNSGFPQGMENYRVLRILKDNGDSYIRISINMELDGDKNGFVFDDMEKYKNFTGNKIITYKI
jgi:hypothetical protein